MCSEVKLAHPLSRKERNLAHILIGIDFIDEFLHVDIGDGWHQERILDVQEG